jgi:4a-hydroxytetrahydrobiopterin dehydratase
MQAPSHARSAAGEGIFGVGEEPTSERDSRDEMPWARRPIWGAGGGGRGTDTRDNDGVATPRLNDGEIAGALASLPEWAREGESIVKVFKRATFPDAITFVVRIGFLAERADHHPDLDIRWRTVRVVLSSHDAGGLTEKDVSLAREIESIAGGA